MENFESNDQADTGGDPVQTTSAPAQVALIAAPSLASLLATTQDQLAESRDACLRARADGENIRRQLFRRCLAIFSHNCSVFLRWFPAGSLAGSRRPAV